MEEMKRNCIKCGATLKENAKFCAKCGEPVTSRDDKTDIKKQNGNASRDNGVPKIVKVPQNVRKKEIKKGLGKRIIISFIVACIAVIGVLLMLGGSVDQGSDIGEYVSGKDKINEYLSENNYVKGTEGAYESPDKQVNVELDEKGMARKVIISGGNTTIFGIGIGDVFSIEKTGKSLTSRGYGFSNEDDMSITYSNEFPGGTKGIKMFVKIDTEEIYNIIYFMECESDDLDATEVEENPEILGRMEPEVTYEKVTSESQEITEEFETSQVYGTFECRDENLSATAVIGMSTENGLEYIYLSGASADGNGVGEFWGEIVSTKENGLSVMDENGNVMDIYCIGIDTIEIQNDTNFGSYGMYFNGFNGIYHKVEDSFSAISVKEQEDDATNYENDYILPYSNTQFISNMGSHVLTMTSEYLRLAKNEIYARHGRKFNDSELQAYFDAQSWYNGTIEPDEFDENVLNEFEKSNIEILNSMLGN